MLDFLKRLFTGEHHSLALDYFNMDPPPIDAVKAREKKIAAAKRKMGDKYILASCVERKDVKRLRRVK